MTEDRKIPPSLAQIAEDFTLETLPQEAPAREDPRSEDGGSRGARFRRKVRSFVMADLAAQMSGKAG